MMLRVSGILRPIEGNVSVERTGQYRSRLAAERPTTMTVTAEDRVYVGCMQENEFYELVKQGSHADTIDRASVASEAVLETLGETLSGGEAEDVASQLPDDLAGVLENADHDGTGYDREESTQRVGEHLRGTDLEAEDTERYATGVAAALAETLTEGELRNPKAQLDDDLRRLFEGTDLDRSAA